MYQQQGAAVLSLVPPLNGKGAPEDEWRGKEGFPAVVISQGRAFPSVDEGVLLQKQTENDCDSKYKLRL